MTKHRKIQTDLFAAEARAAEPVSGPAKEELQTLLATLLLTVIRNRPMTLSTMEVSNDQDYG
jgi:hypothetical protein